MERKYLCRVFVDTVKDAAVFSHTASSIDALVAVAILAASAIVDTVGSVSVISTVVIAHATCRSIPHTLTFLTQAVIPLAGTRRFTISSTDLRVGIYGPGKKDVSPILPGVRTGLPHARKSSFKR
ncbi:hypothetical protein HELRODRAFT_164980 [Helobdella robusta]|uniref:Uncharacterized protein n=1 Tax=Helobdella robusta TaxID=6412 RepID=T1EW21_HELRO|nr:hypothetical protein HELRODRAFT_164980 [Helobdella robusta]ESN92849.1 hypothetical protein HELRODRAFT_164980 [Helobdella robusta]